MLHGGFRVAVLFFLALTGASRGAEPKALFSADFTRPLAEQWSNADGESDWQVSDGVLHRLGATSDNRLVAAIEPIADVLVTAEFQVGDSDRHVFGLAVRVADDDYLLVRYYDRPRALELLAFRGGEWKQVGERGPVTEVEQGVRYRLEVAVVADTLRAKLWPADEETPAWQIATEFSGYAAGSVAIVGHDDTKLAVRSLEIYENHPSLAELERQSEKERAERIAKLRESLRLVAVAEAFPHVVGGHLLRRVHVVPAAGNDRHPIGGVLEVTGPGLEQRHEITLEDYIDQAYWLEVPEPGQPLTLSVEMATELGTTLEAKCTIEPSPATDDYRALVRACLDTLIAHGRDTYGPEQTPLFMAVLDAETLTSPANPMPADALVRLEGRMHRRGERGSNLWYDQNLLKALYEIAEQSGDESYARAADEYVRYFFDHCYKRVDAGQVYLNGMPCWGTHIYWDCYEECPAGDGDGNGPHEILVFRAEWDSMYRVHPEGVRRAIEGIWQHHMVDPATGLHNRHDDRRQGCDFAFSGSSFAHANAFLHAKTGKAEYLRRAKTIAGWHFNNRNPETGLTADCPGLTRRYDGNHCFTTVSGPHAMALLECYSLTQDRYFLDAAVNYIKAYDRYGWDESAQTYWAMLTLDGTPVPDQAKGSGYGAYAPYGHVNVWRTTFYSYEFTLSAAQTVIAAYEVSVADGHPDPELLTIAERWASVVERALPAHTGRRWKAELEQAMPRTKEVGGAYAEDYGRAISFFVHMQRATGDDRYLRRGHELAADAIRKLYHNGLFLAHGAKPYYETTGGVGMLLVALLELDQPQKDLGGAL